MPDVHGEVDDEDDPRVEVPSTERPRERHANRRATAPVDDSGYEHVQGDEKEHDVGGSEGDPSLDEGLGLDDLSRQAGQGLAALCPVHHHQSDEHEADDGVIRDPHVQQLERAERGGGRAKQTEMNCPSGSSAPRAPTAGRPPGRRAGVGLERRVNHLSPTGGRTLGRCRWPHMILSILRFRHGVQVALGAASSLEVFSFARPDVAIGFSRGPMTCHFGRSLCGERLWRGVFSRPISSSALAWRTGVASLAGNHAPGQCGARVTLAE